MSTQRVQRWRSAHKMSQSPQSLQPYLEGLLRQVLAMQSTMGNLEEEDEVQEQKALLDTLCSNMLVELNGKQVLVLRDPGSARLLEQLLGLLLAPESGDITSIANRAARVLSCLVSGPGRTATAPGNSVAPWIHSLLNDANGSHVIEKMLWRLTEPDLNVAYTRTPSRDIDTSAETSEIADTWCPALTVRATLEALCDWWFTPSDEPELLSLNQRGCWFATLMHPSGSHVLRAFLLAISSLPARRLGPSQNWQAHSLEQFLSAAQPIDSTPLCPELIRSKIVPALARLPVALRRRLARFAPASATLQMLLLATLHVCRHEKREKTEPTPTMNPMRSDVPSTQQCWQQLVSVILEIARQDLFRDPAASRLLELALRCARVKLGPDESSVAPCHLELLPFYEKHMAGATRLRRLVLHPQGNYCVQGLLRGADLVVLERALVSDGLLENFIATGEGYTRRPGQDRSGVILSALRAVLEVGVQPNAKTSGLVEQTIDAVQRGIGIRSANATGSPEQVARRIMQTFFPSDERRDGGCSAAVQTEEGSSSPSGLAAGHVQPSAHGSVNGSLLLQLLVRHSAIIREGFMHLSPSELATIASNPTTSHTLEAYVDAVSERPSEVVRTRDQLRQLIPFLDVVAQSPSGARLLDKFAALMEHDLGWRRQVARRLAETFTELAATPHGTRCLRSFQVRMWRDQPARWLAAQQKRLAAKRLLSDILDPSLEDSSKAVTQKRSCPASLTHFEGTQELSSESPILTSSTSCHSRVENASEGSVGASSAPTVAAMAVAATSAPDSPFRSSLAQLDPQRFVKKTPSSAPRNAPLLPAIAGLERLDSADMAPVLEAIQRASAVTRNQGS